MVKKHQTCRWKSEKIKSKRYFILREGCLWLKFVYFQKSKKLIDADIDFFTERIKEYEKILELENKNLFTEDFCIEDLPTFFNREKRTITKKVSEMMKFNFNYKYVKNEKNYISKEGIEWLCKNCFKQKYIELLEQYKMELTEKFIGVGYIYDNFFGLN